MKNTLASARENQQRLCASLPSAKGNTAMLVHVLDVFQVKKGKCQPTALAKN